MKIESSVAPPARTKATFAFRFRNLRASILTSSSRIVQRPGWSVVRIAAELEVAESIGGADDATAFSNGECRVQNAKRKGARRSQDIGNTGH